MVERSALGVVVKAVSAATDHHLALVRLRHVAVNGVRHNDNVHAGLDRLGDESLKCNRFNRQTEPSHFSQNRGVTCNDHTQLIAVDVAFGCGNANNLAAFGADTFDFALLDDVHAHVGTGTCIAPSHRIVTGCAAAFLVEATHDGVARAVDIDDRDQLFQLLWGHPLGRNALQLVRHDGPLIAAHLMVGLREHDQAAGREHDVVVQILGQVLIELESLVVDRRRGVLQVVRTDDRGVTTCVTTAEPAFFDDRDIGDAVILTEVIGGREAVATRTNDDHIVFLLRLGRTPSTLPSCVIA